MINKSMKPWIVFILILFINLGHLPMKSYAYSTDPRFFGTYCGNISYTNKIRVKVKFLGITIYSFTKTVTTDIKDMRLHANYQERSIAGQKVGIVNGKGTYRIKGKKFFCSFGGFVRSQGVLYGSFVTGIKDVEMQRASVSLSPDGLRLTLRFQGKSYTLRKDVCGNAFPTVAIGSPKDGDSRRFGDCWIFNGTVVDEDVTFPPERMVWRSNRDGILSGYSLYGPKKAQLFFNNLSPGAHTITFSATDSGGLTGSKSINISVINQPPWEPTIFKPGVGDLVYASVPTTLLGNAYDLEDGFITGADLIWSSDVDGSIGFGSPHSFTFPTPGTRKIRLTARDTTGSTNFSERTINIQPYTGNSAPQVRIIIPEYYRWRGMAITTGDTISFVGEVSDLESSLDDLTLKWKAVPTNPPGVTDVFGHTTTAEKEFISGVTTTYEITFSATDPGGLTGKETMTLVVLPYIIY